LIFFLTDIGLVAKLMLVEFSKKEKSEMIAELIKLSNKFNRIEKKPIDFGTNEKLFPSEIHTIEAIGKKSYTTVTELCECVGITKGAVSQTVSKLENKGYVEKKRSDAYAKEKIITLTQKGQIAYAGHEKLHDKIDDEFMKNLEDITTEQALLFKKMLRKLSDHLNNYLNII